MQLTNIHVLADKYDVHNFEDECIKQMLILYLKWHGPPNMEVIRCIYSNTTWFGLRLSVKRSLIVMQSTFNLSGIPKDPPQDLFPDLLICGRPRNRYG